METGKKETFALSELGDVQSNASVGSRGMNAKAEIVLSGSLKSSEEA